MSLWLLMICAYISNMLPSCHRGLPVLLHNPCDITCAFFTQHASVVAQLVAQHVTDVGLLPPAPSRVALLVAAL